MKTSNRFARTRPVVDQFFPFGDYCLPARKATNPELRIGGSRPWLVLRQFDYPITDRLLPATRQWHAHEMDVD